MKLSAIVLLCAISLAFGQGETDYTDNDAQILIVGAGIGGLHTADLLKTNNITDFIIIEGDSMPWGTLKSHIIDGNVFELGRPWAHVPAKPIIDALGVKYKESDYDSYVVLSDEGEDVTNAFDEAYGDYDDASEIKGRIVEDAIAMKRLDVNQKTSLAMGGWCGDSVLHQLIEWYELEFDFGKPIDRVSTVGPYTQDAVFGGEEEYYIWDRNGGIFKGVIENLDRGHLRVNQVVTDIDQTGEKAVVTTSDGTVYTGDYVLVTFSIGVLQSCAVTFQPELPQWKTEQINRFQMGAIDPILLKFPSKFWGDEEWILHAGKYQAYYPAFLNAEVEGLYPAGTNVLIAFVTGDEALRVERLTDEEIQAEIVEVLRNMYGAANVLDPVEFFMHRFLTDPLHRGNYATWPIPANSPPDAQQRIQAHVGKVFFCNDAATPFIGTVTSQIVSSEIAVGEMLGCIRGDECKEYEPMKPDQSGEEDVLYGCIRSPKSPGKTRKQPQPGPGNIEIP